MSETPMPAVNLQRPDYEREILNLLQSHHTPIVIQQKLDQFHDSDIAETLKDLSNAEQQKLFNTLDPERLSQIFEHVDVEDLPAYFSRMDITKAVDVLNRMETDISAQMLRKMDGDRSTLIYHSLDPEVARKITIINSFHENQIGSQMSANYIKIHKGITPQQAFNSLIEQAPENDNITTLYVLDENGRFYGAVDLKDLITAAPGTSLEEITATSYPYVYANEPIDEVMEELRDYNEDSIPVLNTNNVLLGVITAQDLLEVMDEELSEDYMKLAGVSAEEDLEETLFQSLKKRLPWLLTLLILGLGVSAVVSLFEGVVAQLTIVMAFQSLILGMAGNAGTQSLAVTIRVLVDESLTTRQKFKLVFKEVRIGFVNGLITGFSSFVILGLYIHFFKAYGWFNAFAISSCIGIALWFAMLISSFTGVSIPLFFKKIGKDPAVASGPLITTINDLVGVVIYYSLAWALLINILHLT